MHDSHVHSIFSDDGMEAVEDVVATALSRGCDYVAITDHVNRDYQVIGYDNPQINKYVGVRRRDARLQTPLQ